MSFYSIAQKLEISGCFSGKNLYFQNLETEVSNIYGTDSVFVNEKKIDLNFNVPAFELKLDSLGYMFGDSVKIILFHKTYFKPKLLNPGGHSLPIIYYFGMPVYEDDQLNAVARKYNVRFINSGCKSTNAYEKHNKEIRDRISTKSGADWEERFWKEVKEKYD